LEQFLFPPFDGTADARFPFMMNVRARDVMQTDVITVTPATPVLEVHRLLLEEDITGAPVVDDVGTVRGVVSNMDLVRAVLDRYETGAAGNAADYFREASPYSGPDWLTSPEDLQDRLRDLTAEDVMTRELVTVKPDTMVSEVARILRDQRVHRVLVVDDGELRGILTTFDLLRLLEAPASRAIAGPNFRQAGDPVCSGEDYP